MTTRNILNADGQVVGQLTLPDGTSEPVWTEAQAPYSAPLPPAPSALDIAKQSIQDAMAFGQDLIAQFGALNVINGLSSVQVAQVAAKLASVQALLLSGSLKTARLAIQGIVVDDYITQAVKDDFAGRITAYLGG